ncbi:response regulator [Cupriavidus sp. AU9028]|uniref:response regulator n=1 Tax=Cupriavidus sp. AU9028 TaxID=2871157 RepID=UPI001C97C3A8|nr:response regulator [Cupriavidus sp. AU9028]MBY4897348.1 response regulator [Cupriavidus sp. AU9028]
MNEPTDNQAAPPAILFVDDEATAVKYFQRAIGSLAPVVTGGSVEEGKALLERHGESLAVLVSDQRMPGEYGNELLRHAREKYPHIVRILTTAYSELEATVQAVNEGQIHRYIKKPWDITALRMEMKQALEISGLRRERDQLLREKLGVIQRQSQAARVGMVRALCGSLVGAERFQPVETYLSGAALAGARTPAPDWARMDYADLAAAESGRGAAFGHAVARRLEGLRQGAASEAAALDALAALPDAQVRREGNVLVWSDAGSFGEFMAGPVSSAVSERHAAWLAVLLWLDQAGLTVQLRREGELVVGSVVPASQSFGGDRLAVWIEQF